MTPASGCQWVLVRKRLGGSASSPRSDGADEVRLPDVLLETASQGGGGSRARFSKIGSSYLFRFDMSGGARGQPVRISGAA